MQQSQLKTNEPDAGSDVSKTGIEQGGTSVVQDLVKNQELMDSRVEFVDDLNHAMEEVDVNVQADRAQGKFEKFTINGLNSAVEAVKAKYKVSSLQARRYLADTKAVKENRKLASLLREDIARAEAFTRIKASFEKIIFHHLSTIVTKFVVGFANQLEKAANIDQTLKNRKLKKQAEKANKEAAFRQQEMVEAEQRRKAEIWSNWGDEVKSAIGKISLTGFKVTSELLGRDSIMTKTSNLEKTYYAQFIPTEKKYYSFDREMGPLEAYETNLESGTKVKLSVGFFKERDRLTDTSYEKRVEAQLEIEIPPNCVVVSYDVTEKKTGYSELNRTNELKSVIHRFENDSGSKRYFILKLEESNGSLSSKVLDTFEFSLPAKRDY